MSSDAFARTDVCARSSPIAEDVVREPSKNARNTAVTLFDNPEPWQPLAQCEAHANKGHCKHAF